ncbi:hypothetical protein H257_12692 [Aphanomyces astaci]|uniref:Uncharacterized protein n=1 Tax=Aphanomyces astaci TaxID=112090 RepID=W4FZL6_APHAT|nr:hypothetical protein H257_12692 [Aphanomyces astaci]ETV72219.1 hypothetical protein H257_12692 [Aphanomyces astaci]|eukprot:XP_009838287.1 hypothetical protein H257_12692 [Aphanomyces astaci]
MSVLATSLLAGLLQGYHSTKPILLSCRRILSTTTATLRRRTGCHVPHTVQSSLNAWHPASLVCHFDYVVDTLPAKHIVFGTPIFRQPLMLEALKADKPAAATIWHPTTNLHYAGKTSKVSELRFCIRGADGCTSFQRDLNSPPPRQQQLSHFGG